MAETLMPNALVVLTVDVAENATLPQAIRAMLRVARALNCVVRSTWNDETFTVNGDESYSAAQDRILKQLKVNGR